MKYLHLISCDKFTEGFINFICSNFDSKEHSFIIYGKWEHMKKFTKPNVIGINYYKEILHDSAAKKWINECQLIIVNGLFGVEKCLIYFMPGVLKKTFLMFWGDDFYCFRNKKRYSLGELYKLFVIKNSAGVINLIENDYQELCKIITPKGKHFIAPMSDDGYVFQLIRKFYYFPKNIDEQIILVGNSATETNNHFSTFQQLKRFRNENFKLICPLSYGNEIYRSKVIQAGKKLFGEKFIPLISYMEKDKYMEMLSHVNIAIFNNNRQQAMGNINACLGLGVKVFIRNDTGMWGNYSEKMQYYVYNINDIANISFEEFVSFDAHIAEHNRKKCSEYYENSEAFDQWKIVFDSIDQK